MRADGPPHRDRPGLQEEIARLAGHASSRTTEVIYRRELRPVITTGAEVMDQIFRSKQRGGNAATAAEWRILLSGRDAQELLQVLTGDEPSSAYLHVAQVPAPHQVI
jgi:hypothetical protein